VKRTQPGHANQLGGGGRRRGSRVAAVPNSKRKLGPTAPNSGGNQKRDVDLQRAGEHAAVHHVNVYRGKTLYRDTQRAITDPRDRAQQSRSARR